jgi:hypothetical protein
LLDSRFVLVDDHELRGPGRLVADVLIAVDDPAREVDVKAAVAAMPTPAITAA